MEGCEKEVLKEGPCAKDDQATFNYKWTAQIVNHAEDEDNDGFDDDLAMRKENDLGSFIAKSAIFKIWVFWVISMHYIYFVCHRYT